MANALNFGEAEFINNVRLNSNLLRYRSQNNPGNSFLFRKTKTCGETSYWSCVNCVKIVDLNLRLRATIILHGKEIVRDPENGHHPNCVPIPDGEVEAMQLVREAKKECKIGRKRPLQAFTENQAEISMRFKNDDDLQDSVEENYPDFRSVRRALYRFGEKGRIPIPDPRNLPEEYCLTHRGRHAENNSSYFRERWLLYSSPDLSPLVHLFVSDLDLQVLHKSHCWIMDGTFKVCPKDFAQLYTVHGFGSFQAEAHPVAHALLANKTEATYTEILPKIQQKLQAEFGSDDQLQVVLLDFEKAAHNAVHQVYPTVSIKGCNFHFGQALHRKLQQLGGQGALQIAIVEEWIGCIRSMSILPPPLLKLAWEVILQHPPVIPNQQEYQALVQFANYFSQYWLNERDFAVSTWNHWDNDGLRTTNHAEGYHSLVNQNDCTEMHMVLRNFLSWLQLAHNRNQVRIRNLLKANELPKARNPIYADLHERIIQTKQSFFQRTAYY